MSLMLGALFIGLLGCSTVSKPIAHSGGDKCVDCHVGIEPIHKPEYIAADSCTECHGGDGTATTQDSAHVAVPDNYWEVRGDGLPDAPEGFIKDMAPDQLDQLKPEYIQFINPGDIRVAAETCGTCHTGRVDMVQAVKNSIMTTNAGHYMPTRFLAGVQDQDAIYGAYAASDPDWDGEPGTVPELQQLRPVDAETLERAIDAGDPETLEGMAIDHYLSKSCNTCHAAGYPRNDAPHLYRSTGCTSCHMVYDSDGVYTGDDAAMPNNVPVYPSKHTITKAIPTEQCATCHFQGGRIGLLFRGIREGGFSDTPPHAEVWKESAYGHASGYYILDEDTRNDVDETPPDLHYAAGMECADCHVGTDVHGDGRIYTTDKQQVDLRCEDCHGTPRQRVLPGPDGSYYTSSGRRLPQLSTGGDGSVILTGVMDGEEHEVPQPAQLLSSGEASAEMQRAMAPNSDDWTHADSLTCDTCHNSHQQFCIGCHVSMDMRLSQVDYQTGLKTHGLVWGSRGTYTLDHLLLAQAPDGRAQATNPSQQLQLSLFDSDGTRQLGGVVDGEEEGQYRTSENGPTNIGFAPFFQHTSASKPRDCETCHQQESTPEELARVRGVYGYGTGEFMLPNPDGEPVDALKFLDEDGNPVTTWAHEGTGPLSAEVRARAIGVILSELEE
jgi:hypothetical protein